MAWLGYSFYLVVINDETTFVEVGGKCTLIYNTFLVSHAYPVWPAWNHVLLHNHNTLEICKKFCQYVDMAV